MKHNIAAIAKKHGVNLTQVVRMPDMIDAMAGSFGQYRRMGQVWKIVDDLEYPLYVLYRDDDAVPFLFRHLCGNHRSSYPPSFIE